MCLISPLYVLLDFILGPGCEGDYGNRTLCIVPILIPLSYVRRIIGQRRALALSGEGRSGSGSSGQNIPAMGYPYRV
jgi:hypothetical protein